LHIRPNSRRRLGSRRLARSRPLTRPCGPLPRFAEQIPFAVPHTAQVSRLETCIAPGNGRPSGKAAFQTWIAQLRVRCRLPRRPRIHWARCGWCWIT
jgi:hypothetical protein